MSDFETLHPRQAAGRFAAKRNDAPTAALDAATLPSGRTPTPGRVSFDGETYYDAADIDPNIRWNGFANPLFTREVAEQIVASMGEDDASFEWDGDTLMETYDGDRQDVGTVTLSDGTVLYGVGRSSWTWSEDD